MDYLKPFFLVVLFYSTVYVLNAQSDYDSLSIEEFNYSYLDTKYVPPPGKTLLIMGQTKERIDEYMDNYSDQKLPAGWAAYWGVSDKRGITNDFEVTPGNTQNHKYLVNQFPNAIIQSAMWMVGMYDIAKKTSEGAYDDALKKYVKWARATDRPIYLRIGYEFDGIHNELEPKEYVKAYRYVVDFLRSKKVDNVAFVWHSYASERYKGYPLSDWYPGNDYVDWVGISVFGHAYNGEDFGPHCDEVLTFAKNHKKPVMIAESNPIHGITPSSDAVWKEWFVPFFAFIEKKNIKAVSFINENWPQTGIPGIGSWKDSRLWNNPQVGSAWFKEVSKDRYLMASPDLFEILGYE